VVVDVMFADVEKWLTEEQHWTVGGVCRLQLHCVMRWFQPLAPVDVLTGGQRWGGVCHLQLHCVMLVVSAAGTGGRASVVSEGGVRRRRQTQGTDDEQGRTGDEHETAAQSQGARTAVSFSDDCSYSSCCSSKPRCTYCCVVQ